MSRHLLKYFNVLGVCTEGNKRERFGRVPAKIIFTKFHRILAKGRLESIALNFRIKLILKLAVILLSTVSRYPLGKLLLLNYLLVLSFVNLVTTFTGCFSTYFSISVYPSLFFDGIVSLLRISLYSFIRLCMLPVHCTVFTVTYFAILIFTIAVCIYRNV